MSWIDNYGDRDGDGFQEYQTRSPVGYENMSWKDFGDCVVYPDGSLVKGTEGTLRAYKVMSTMPGFVWPRCSMRSVSLIAQQALRAKASALFDLFNEAFWDEELASMPMRSMARRRRC